MKAITVARIFCAECNVFRLKPILFLLFLLLASCHDEGSGKRQVFKKDGRSFDWYIDKKGMQGIQKSFDPNGKLEAVLRYRDNKPDGEQLTYHKNGRLAARFY